MINVKFPIKVKDLAKVVDQANINTHTMNFEDITLRVKTSHRGGGIEIDLTSLGYPHMKMTAYQNYLGGGMLGSIGSDCTIRDFRNHDDLVEISENLKRYFHSLTNHVEDEWESASYEANQRRPSSAY